MLPLTFHTEPGSQLSVLCLGAHSDDIEIGCGGTLLRLASHYALDVTWVVLGAAGDRRAEAERSAGDFLSGAASSKLRIAEFRNSFFPWDGREIKEYIEGLKADCNPDVVLTHYRDDLHQDHRLVGELTWNSFRDHLVLEYEIPKYDGGLGSPAFFVPLKPETCDRKIELLLKHFQSQRSRQWFSEDTFRAMLRLRGIECNSPSGYAEAFYVRKLVV